MQRSDYNFCSCGKLKKKLSSVCVSCKNSKNPTPKQLIALKLYWLIGNRKAVAEFMNISTRTLEYHLAELTNKIVGRKVREGSSYMMTSLFKWGVRAGILSLFVLTVGARPFWKHPPQPTIYTTNYARVTVGWNPVSTNVYQVQYAPNGKQPMLSALTFSTTFTLSQMITGTVYSFVVRDAYANAGTNLWSNFSSSIQFGTTSNVITRAVPILNTTGQ